MTEETLRRLRERDWQAWDEWIRRWASPIARIVRLHERRKDLREELFAIVLAECARAILTRPIARLEPHDQLVVRIARLRCVDWIREQSRTRHHEGEGQGSGLLSTLPAPARSGRGAGALRERLEAWLSELPDARWGEAIRARYLEGNLTAEMAERYGVGAATVRSWIHRGIKTLRRRHGEEAGELLAGLEPFET
jgi:RNA polymerase sigma factor (sigma-70 family)